ncbi:MAG: hypothetical protein IH866_03100 [Chloroflexi bacterium]|nr:hypothetical protein [Chloroflexota bacterium]
MTEEQVIERLAALSGSARRLLDYLAILDRPGRYAVLRHLARATEEDMVVDLQEVVAAGLVVAAEDDPNAYDFTDEELRPHLLANIGDMRLPKLRARAQAAQRRVSGDLRLEP